MLTNDEILDLVKNGSGPARKKADLAIRERLLASGAKPAVVSAAMYYAYERGHSAGECEVLYLALNLCAEVFEAK